MVSFNKAILGGLAAGGLNTGQLQPVGDYLASGLSTEMAKTAFGAFSPAMVTFASAAIVALISAVVAGFIIYLTPNAPQGVTK